MPNPWATDHTGHTIAIEIAKITGRRITHTDGVTPGLLPRIDASGLSKNRSVEVPDTETNEATTRASARTGHRFRDPQAPSATNKTKDRRYPT